MTNSQSPYRMRAENLLPKFESTKNPFASIPKTEAPKSEPATPPPIAAPCAVMVAPMETYPLFDVELKPILAVAAVAAKMNETEAVAIPVNAPAKVSPAKASVQPVLEQRRVMQPEPNRGLVDASPLGLKTGTPTRAPLPAPVIAPPKVPANQPAQPMPTEPPTPSPDHESSRIAAKPAKSEQTFGWLAPLFKLFRFGRRSQNINARKPVQTELSLDRVKVIRNDLNETDLEVVTIKKSEKADAPPVRLAPLAEADAGNFSRIASRIFGTSQSLVR